MDQMIEDILAYSRMQMRPLKPMPTDVTQLVQQVVSEFEPQLRDGIELEQDVEAGVMECDREGLTQILRNFLSNAIKFSRGRTPPHIRVEGRCHAPGYRFSVHDNGVGFDMCYRDRIFEMFHRLPNGKELEGTGIGLALAARAAERMGGQVWAESRLGQGATFFLQLNGGTPT
jgi:signal transduction histidine kinase